MPPPPPLLRMWTTKAVKSGIDIFRVFDSLNYGANMKLGIEAAAAAGGFVEAAICYTGDVTKRENNKYPLSYYVDYAKELVDMGAHALAIKDMAGLLTPQAATLLVGSLREQFPDVPIHVHSKPLTQNITHYHERTPFQIELNQQPSSDSLPPDSPTEMQILKILNDRNAAHDTPGTGVASMLAAAAAGADVVDGAIDAMSGLTSQPSPGAIVGASGDSTSLNLSALQYLNRYWEDVRALYLPFESGQLSGSSDVFSHEIPGGQYTNLLFQSKQLGLTGRFAEIKAAYAAANKLLGDIPKVTPSSKVVGDLAQFMVAQRLSPQDVVEQATLLPLPNSVVEYFQGYLGPPPGGFPEPLRSRVLEGRSLPDGRPCFDGRPGAELEPCASVGLFRQD